MNLAAIFDWDGVIVDSSHAHEQSWEHLAAEEHRLLPPGHFQRSFGMKNEKIIPELLGWTHDKPTIHRLSLRKEELYRQIIRETGITALPGVAEFLARLKAADIPCVIGSSTHRLNIETILDVLGFRHHFRAIVSAEDVTHGKPAPDIFLLAANKLAAPAERCVVFEDAHVGIEAALAAGMKVVGVATTHPAETLTGAHRIVHRLDELQPADLAVLVS